MSSRSWATTSTCGGLAAHSPCRLQPAISSAATRLRRDAAISKELILESDLDIASLVIVQRWVVWRLSREIQELRVKRRIAIKQIVDPAIDREVPNAAVLEVEVDDAERRDSGGNAPVHLLEVRP